VAAKRDYYEILGVSRDASDGDIKRAFRRLARELHPDVNPDPAAAAGFREAAEAYEVLSDANTRARYDRFGHAGIAGQQFHTEQFMDFSSLTDLLGAFFGDDLFAGMGQRGPARGGHASAAVELTLAEVATGATRTVDVDLVVTCDTCQGSGARAGTTPRTCPECSGAGRVQHVVRTAFGQMVQTGACAACGGTGRRIDDPCPDCKGHGRRQGRFAVEVRVPAGIMDGQTLRLPGRGHAGEPGGEPGDLYVNVTVAEDPRFQRDGADLVSVLELPFTQAAMGAHLTVPTLEGDHEVTIAPGVQPGEVVTLRGRGLPSLRGRGRGDLRVVVNVLVPRHLNDAQRRLLADFERSVDETTYARDEGFFSRLRAALR
jgi:molecular chaperone DnaJ